MDQNDSCRRTLIASPVPPRYSTSGNEGPVPQCIATYGAYSGSNNGYGFFAPAVASRWQARFSLYDEQGNGWIEESWEPGNRELSLRHAAILGMFAHANFREELAASWAARMFARHPDARMINVHVQMYRVPPMSDFTTGDRPEWVTVAVYSFGHNVERDIVEE